MIFKRHFCATVFLVVFGGASATQAAYTTYYSDLTTFAGTGYAAGGAGGASTALGNTTTMAADDITAAAGSAGGSVNSISFTVANFNATSVLASPILSIYDGSGSGGGPGQLLAVLDFTPISFTGGNVVQTFTYTSATSIFTMPSGLFWAGLSFSDNGGTTGATTAQLNNLGQGVYAPPTVGSSLNLFYKATSSASILTNNPAGSFLYFGGTPVADFGFAFSGNPLVTVPEPSSAVLLGLAGLSIAGGRRLVRNHRAARAA